MTAGWDKPLPAIDRDSEPFWDGVRAEELRVQRCTGCGAYRWPARAICNRCHSFEAEWTALSGKGTVISWIETHQVFIGSFRGDLPYRTILIQLDEQDDLQIVGQFTDPKVEPRDGMPVHAVFKPVTDQATLIYWEPD